MNINQLSEIIKIKILNDELIKKLEVEDKSYLHKNHKSREAGKFHIKLKIESTELQNKDKVYSNRYIYKILKEEMKFYIHSLQIEFV
tara:strand:+ start:561 stop:821 length:261 start_codon:yes stop_codon:yes gene_type:complete